MGHQGVGGWGGLPERGLEGGREAWEPEQSGQALGRGGRGAGGDGAAGVGRGSQQGRQSAGSDCQGLGAREGVQ